MRKRKVHARGYYAETIDFDCLFYWCVFAHPASRRGYYAENKMCHEKQIELAETACSPEQPFAN